jgi:hypothetical protein
VKVRFGKSFCFSADRIDKSSVSVISQQQRDKDPRNNNITKTEEIELAFWNINRWEDL